MWPGTIAARVLVGLLVGILVGLTGIGGGLLMVPLLISVLGVPPIIAVGSDAVINSVTKIGAGALHWRQGNVRWPLVLRLACGSIPGSILGVLVLTQVRQAYGSGVNSFLRAAVGLLLVVIPTVYLAGQYFQAARGASDASPKIRNQFGIAIIGFLAGFLVGVTSIGAGSVILIMLLMIYGLAPAVTVGTDIVHGVLLAGFTGLLQFKLGNVDLMLVGSILVGSMPGSILGVHLTRHLSSVRLKQILCLILAALGARMLLSVLRHVD
jgi:uncharacterized membrane protein YfcA